MRIANAVIAVIPALTVIGALPLRAAMAAGETRGNLIGHTARPLRYRPEGRDFVIENGVESFNRPLYGNNTAFRVDAGDRPEFLLYLPGRGGNLRLGIRTGAGAKWLIDARKLITRYRPGSMLYEIHDPLLGGSGTLRLTALAMSAAEGLVLRAELSGTISPAELIWAYGGANGEKGARNGDIGTERLPISQFFQLRPETCRGNVFTLDGSQFTLHSRVGDVRGLMPPGATLALADATRWAHPVDLFHAAGKAVELPVVIGRVALHPGQPLYLGLQPIGEKQPAYRTVDLPGVFADSEQHRRALAERVVVDTPDPFINAAASALCIAADGVWDETQGAFMHGAVAWRRKLLGWRGGYTGDELGWHDRTRRHLMNWLPAQNTGPVPPSAPEPSRVPPDTSVHLGRNEPALHSNGDLSNSHYDMNLPAIDILFRHILWTGDLKFARQVWPNIERHLAWERRLFRRPFGPDSLPLYEAYACIWASDDLQYNGGGVAHSSAYNYYHNKMAAHIARLIGKDPMPYEREAALISKAMHQELWLPDRGWYAESKDLLGLQRTHPSAALWTFYHTMDSEVPTPREAWQMTRFVDTQIAHIPVHGPGVPTDRPYFTLPTTDWMPYTWSTNNVVMAEAAHTSLAYWEAGRADTAFPLFKGLLLDSMFMGLCPGNVGMTTTFDMARGEAQRDFADGVGTVSRALIEGLFGARPDALSGELRICPGFPASWDRATLRHPDLLFTFRRAGMKEVYSITPKFDSPMKLRLQIPALRDNIASVQVNGHPAKWKPVDDAVGLPHIEIESATAPKYEVVIVWRGSKPAVASVAAVVAKGAPLDVKFGPARLVQIADPQKALSGAVTGADSLRAKATGTAGYRTVFGKVRQGEMIWWAPVAFEVRPAWEIIPADNQDASHLRLRVRNNTPKAINRDVAIRSGGRTLRSHLRAPAFGESGEIALAAQGLLPGANPITMELGGGISVSGVVTNWKVAASAANWEPVSLAARFNDRVTQIFQNEYRSPRSPYTSLAIPLQGYGSWIHTDADYTVDDTGLRAVASRSQGRFVLPQGIPFQTPGTGDTKNIAFLSRWDNYPHEMSVPLSGKAAHAYLLMAGSTDWMQSRLDNGEVIVTYADGTTERLALRNPTNWWPIDQDYFIDDYAFRRPEPIPPRVDLKTGAVRVPDLAEFKGKTIKIDGGAATVLDLPLNPARELKSLTVRALANDIVVGLMAVTLVRTEMHGSARHLDESSSR